MVDNKKAKLVIGTLAAAVVCALGVWALSPGGSGDDSARLAEGRTEKASPITPAPTTDEVDKRKPVLPSVDKPVPKKAKPDGAPKRLEKKPRRRGAHKPQAKKDDLPPS